MELTKYRRNKMVDTNTETGMTCNQHTECANAGKYKACTYSDGSRCAAFLKKEINNIHLPFGNMVMVDAQYHRHWKRKHNPRYSKLTREHEYKYWHIDHWKFSRKGIFLGYRHLKDGWIYRSYDEGTEFDMNVSFKVGLVCLSEHENPIYVPLENIVPLKEK